MAYSYTVDTWDDHEERVSIDRDFSARKITPELKIADEEIENLRRIYNRFDRKNVGYIHCNYIVSIFKLAGQNPSQEVEDKLLAKANQQGTGVLIFAEMVEIFEKFWKTQETYLEELREAISAFDTRGTSVVDIRELRYFLTTFGEQFDKKDADLFEKFIRTNNEDGKILIDDFMKLMTKTRDKSMKRRRSRKFRRTKGSIFKNVQQNQDQDYEEDEDEDEDIIDCITELEERTYMIGLTK